jgi:predicted lysophospholipase L1 biosynthesis ABC-type transport system permease subunit
MRTKEQMKNILELCRIGSVFGTQNERKTMFYLLGSLLFAIAMMAAFAVMIDNFAQYRRAMIAALRTLSMDGFAASPTPAKPVPFNRQPVTALTPRQAAA